MARTYRSGAVRSARSQARRISRDSCSWLCDSLSNRESHAEDQGGRSEPEKLGWAAFLRVIQLIVRLRIVARLSGDMKIGIGWDETIHEVRSDRTFVMIFENEFAIGSSI